MDWENQKNPIQKIEKTVMKVELPHVNKIPVERKRTFFKHRFLYFKIRAKTLDAAKPLAFSLHYLF